MGTAILIGSTCLSCPAHTGIKTAATSQDDCGICPKGQYITTSHTCINCPDGQGSTGLTPIAYCNSCPKGTYSDGSAAGLATTVDGCQFCPAGTGVFPNTFSLESCGSCGLGKYSAGDGKGCIGICVAGTGSAWRAASQDTCGACNPGTYSLGDGNGCIGCPAGTSSPPGSLSSASCTACPAGQFSTAGQPCTNCYPGWYGPSSGAVSCTQCPSGYALPLYVRDRYGQNANSLALKRSGGSTSPCCKCCAGYYSNYSANGCAKCPGMRP